MILQSLVNYYERKAANAEGSIAPEGLERKEIPFVIVIDGEGKLVELEDTREGEGRKRRARSFLVPQGVKRSSGVRANLLWDTAEYVLGVNLRGNAERAARQHEAFVAKFHEAFGEDPGDMGLRAVGRFLLTFRETDVEAFAAWQEVRDSNANMTFRLAGDTGVVAERPGVRAGAPGGRADRKARCLVTGELGHIALTHASIKGVQDSRPTGGNIVSFNLPAFSSYGRIQGENAPVGERAAFWYTTALNSLLAKDSRQKIQVGDATVVFWAERDTGSPAEDAFRDWFDPPADDPDHGTERVRALLGLQQGRPLTGDDEQRFFVLGLSPNAARISVRFWQVCTVQELGERIFRHFSGLAISRGPNDPDIPSLRSLLRELAVLGKLENLPPNLAGEWMRSILLGAPYPLTLLQTALRRARAEREVRYCRAAIIKACLYRMTDDDKEKPTVSLDPTNRNPGYRLGRLFAVLERIQEEASPGLNATIRDRYFGAASTNPRTVFPVLNRLKNHHLAKLENRGRAVNLERLVAEIVDGLDAADPFPANFSLVDQGRFAVGYYHQRQHSSTYKSKEN